MDEKNSGPRGWDGPPFFSALNKKIVLHRLKSHRMPQFFSSSKSVSTMGSFISIRPLRPASFEALKDSAACLDITKIQLSHNEHFRELLMDIRKGKATNRLTLLYDILKLHI